VLGGKIWVGCPELVSTRKSIGQADRCELCSWKDGGELASWTDQNLAGGSADMSGSEKGGGSI